MGDDSVRKAFSMEKLLAGFPAYRRQKLLQSHFLQSFNEKKARIKLVQELSLELAEIRKTEKFVVFGESAIEAVIEGDWKQLADVMGWLTFSDEALEYRQHMAPTWAKFREMLHIACVEARHRQETETRDLLGEETEKSS